MNQGVQISLPVDKPLEDRRRAVYTALNEHMSEDELWESLAHWEDSYAGEPRFYVQNFLADVLNTPKLRLLRLRLLQVLLKTMTMPPSGLLPDPYEQVRAYRNRRAKAASAPSTLDPVIGACTGFLAGILRNLDDNNRARTRQFVINQIDNSDLAMSTRSVVRAWLADPTRMTLAGADPKDLSRLVSVVYIGLCEFIGPVAADSALNRSFKKIELEQPELVSHVRNLL